MTTKLAASRNTDLALKIVSMSVGAVLLVLLLERLKILIVCIVLAITLASSLTPLAEAAQRKKVPRVLTVMGIYIVAGSLYFTVGAMLLPAVHEQWQRLMENFPTYLTGVNHWYQHALNMAGSRADALSFDLEDLRTVAIKLIRQTLTTGAGAIGLLGNIILILFLAAYLVIEAERIWPALLKWLPPNSRVRAAALVTPLAQRMGGYVHGQILVALAVSAVLIAGFSIMDVKYALLLGILGGVLNLIPYIGALIATACALLVAFNQTPMLAVAVLVFYAFEQWLESSFLVPHFLGNSVTLHPLVVLLAILTGAALLGIPGALISVPLTSAAMFLAEEFYLKKLDPLEPNDAQS
ncbi:MAG: AI-2E family transporter [Cyanobacteria bacterium REEB67]|nr:AI-2E family transporter [Cyanobacteria bacterium REEB67]